MQGFYRFFNLFEYKMGTSDLLYPLIGIVFTLGYLAIICEFYIKVNKTAVALLVAVVCWAIYFFFSRAPLPDDLRILGEHVSDVSQIIFFLMGAMTLVELVDSHRGFKIITDAISTTSKRKLLWIISITTFFLSSVLDNLTTAILMVSLLRKIIPIRSDRFLLSCIVIVAANSGGAWTPIGDVTTTMLWINGQISTLKIMKTLFISSIISTLVPLLFFHFFTEKGTYEISKENQKFKNEMAEPGAKMVFFLGIGSLIFVPIFKALTGLPPFMGILIGLAIVWLVTDLLHHKHEHRRHLRVPAVLTRIDTSGILFFLGILLCVNALQTAGLLKDLADLLQRTIGNQAVIVTLIGIISAIIDNVPLVAATMGMYPLSSFPMDSPLWQMIAYAAGTGGSILLIGSAAGVALMSMEKIEFFAYMKKMSLPVLIGYLAGMGAYLLLF